MKTQEHNNLQSQINSLKDLQKSNQEQIQEVRKLIEDKSKKVMREFSETLYDALSDVNNHSHKVEFIHPMKKTRNNFQPSIKNMEWGFLNNSKASLWSRICKLFKK